MQPPLQDGANNSKLNTGSERATKNGKSNVNTRDFTSRIGDDVKDRRMFTGSNADSISWDKLANSKTPKFSNGRPTRLSWRQCAAIQGFPKNYPFYGTVSQIYKQIGNAVPPILVKKILTHLKNNI